MVPLHVGAELRLPEIRSGGGLGRVAASLMTVPEAAVDKADSLEPMEDQIRRSGELPIMKTVPEAACMQRAAKCQLRSGILGANPRHHSRAGSAINYVGHRSACVAMEG